MGVGGAQQVLREREGPTGPPGEVGSAVGVPLGLGVLVEEHLAPGQPDQRLAVADEIAVGQHVDERDGVADVLTGDRGVPFIRLADGGKGEDLHSPELVTPFSGAGKGEGELLPDAGKPGGEQRVVAPLDDERDAPLGRRRQGAPLHFPLQQGTGLRVTPQVTLYKGALDESGGPQRVLPIRMVGPPQPDQLMKQIAALLHGPGGAECAGAREHEFTAGVEVLGRVGQDTQHDAQPPRGEGRRTDGRLFGGADQHTGGSGVPPREHLLQVVRLVDDRGPDEGQRGGGLPMKPLP